MRVHSISDSTYWSAQALISLGRNEEARQMLQKIYDYSWSLERQEPKIDYFATSLPAMLLFEEDLLRRQEIEAKFLRTQALLGLGQKEHAYTLINEVLTMDANHSGAADLLATLETTVN
jgi:Tfp pilus assembly protein FimV